MPSVRGRNRPAAPSPLERRALAEDRRLRAREELLEVRDRGGSPYLVLEVTNPVRGSRYRVFLPAYPELEPIVCECTDYSRRGLGTCKHIEAAREWLAHDAPAGRAGEGSTGEPAPGRLWREIDARQAHRGRDPAPESLAWRRPGAALFAGIDREG